MGAAQGAPCAITVTRTVAPLDPEIGTDVVITTGVRTHCIDAATRPLHLVLLIDASDKMAGGKLDEARRALEGALRAMNLPSKPHVRVGVVSFAETARSGRPLARVTDVQDLVADLNNIKLGGSARLESGISESLIALGAVRNLESPALLREVVFLVSSDEGEESTCENVRQKARGLRDSGIVLTAACHGARCLIGCLPLTLKPFMYQLLAWDGLREPLSDLLQARGPFAPIRTVEVQDTLAPQLRYVGGGDPTGGAGNVLAWTIERWTKDSVTLTYQAEVMTCGRFTSSVPGETESYAAVEYQDPLYRDLRQTITLPDVELDVPCEPVTPVTPQTPETPATPGTPSTPNTPATPASPTTPTTTATPGTPTIPVTPGTPSTPTKSPTTGTLTPTGPSSTPTHTPTPTRTATSTIPPPQPMARIWLPIALPGACLGERDAVDLIIMADVSGSMSTPDVPGSLNRWTAERALVRAMIFGGDGATGLRPGRDRFGLVVFGLDPESLITWDLEPCCDPSRAVSLETFWQFDGSDYALALRSAAALFADTPPRNAQRVLVIMTDGDLNRTPPEGFQRALDALDQAAVERHAIGIGAAARRADLVRLAGHPSRAHRAADHPAVTVPRALVSLPRCPR